LRKARPAPPDKRRSDPGRALLIVDNAPLIKGHRLQYQRVLKAIAKSENELRKHEAEDGPAFDQWFHGTFGEQITAMRAGDEEIGRMARVFMEMESLQMLDGCSEVVAFHRVKLREQGLPDPYEQRPDSGDRQKDAWEAGKAGKEDADADFDDVEEFREFVKQQGEAYREETGEFPPGYEEVLERLGAGGAVAKPSAQLKKLYRQIVTRLHPDRGGKFSPLEEALWHETQTAYRAGDASALEVILARCEAVQDGVEITRCSLIVGMIRQARSSLAQLRKRLAGLKKHPSWNFSARKDRAVMRRKILLDFELDLEEQAWRLEDMRMEYFAIEKRHAKWLAKQGKEEKPPAKGTKLKPRKPRVDYRQSDFWGN
jgi:hypothetical protein